MEWCGCGGSVLIGWSALSIGVVFMKTNSTIVDEAVQSRLCTGFLWLVFFSRWRRDSSKRSKTMDKNAKRRGLQSKDSSLSSLVIRSEPVGDDV